MLLVFFSEEIQAAVYAQSLCMSHMYLKILEVEDSEMGCQI